MLYIYIVCACTLKHKKKCTKKCIAVCESLGSVVQQNSPVIKTAWICGSILCYKMLTEKVSCRSSSLYYCLSLFVGMWDSGYHQEDVLWVDLFFVFLPMTISFHYLHKWHTACHPHWFNSVMLICAMKWWYSNPPCQLSVHKNSFSVFIQCSQLSFQKLDQ